MPIPEDADRQRLAALERALAGRGRDLALFLVFDRPARVNERPDLARVFFAERCVSDQQLTEIIEAFREIGSYVELFDGERPFIRALSDGRLHRLERSLKVAYNGMGWGITRGGFKPGRKALVPAVADAFGVFCANSDAYTCAFALHKFHSFVVLGALGVRVPRAWCFAPPAGWTGPPPEHGVKVIAKSTYEAWSVGVTDESVFVTGEATDARVAQIADDIGQPVTVQEFVAGREVCVTVLSCPERIVAPPVEQILDKAPGDPEAVMTIDDNLREGAVRYVRFDALSPLLDDLRDTATKVFDLLQMEGMGRIDFRIDSAGRAWVTDAAVSPGLSRASSAFAASRELGFDHPGFLRLVIAANLSGARLLA